MIWQNPFIPSLLQCACTHFGNCLTGANFVDDVILFVYSVNFWRLVCFKWYPTPSNLQVANVDPFCMVVLYVVGYFDYQN